MRTVFGSIVVFLMMAALAFAAAWNQGDKSSGCFRETRGLLQSDQGTRPPADGRLAMLSITGMT